MRALIILGVFAVWALLVATEDGAGEKSTFDLIGLVGDDGRGGRMEGGPSSPIGEEGFRREESAAPAKSKKKKKCSGCYTALSPGEPKRFEAPLLQRSKKDSRSLHKGEGKKEHQREGRRERQREGRGKGRKGKKNGGKRRTEELEGTMRPHHDRRHHHHHRPDHHQNHHPEGVKEEKIKRRWGSRSAITSSRYEGIKEDLGDGTLIQSYEGPARKKRQSRKEKKGTRRPGLGSAIASVNVKPSFG